MSDIDDGTGMKTKAFIAFILAVSGIIGAPIVRCCIMKECLREPKERDPFDDFLKSKRSITNFKLPTNGAKATEDDEKTEPDGAGNKESDGVELLAGQRLIPPKSKIGFQHDFVASSSVDFYLDCVGHKIVHHDDDNDKKGCRCDWCICCACCHDQFRFSVVFRSTSHAVFFGFLSVFVSWVGYECGDGGCYKVWGEQMAAIDGIYSILSPLLMFILAIYVNNRLSWWFQIKTKCWKVQGGLHEYALLMAAALRGGSGDDDKEAYGDARMNIKYRVYRYLNLIHYFMYYSAHNDPGPLSLEKLKKNELLTPNEVKLLMDADELPIGESHQKIKACRYWSKTLCCMNNPCPWTCLVADGRCRMHYNKGHMCPQNCVNQYMSEEDTRRAQKKVRAKGKPRCNSYHRLPLLWLTQLTGHIDAKTKILTTNQSYHLYGSIRRIRGDIVSLLDHDNNKPPYSWMQLLQIYVDVVLLMTPFALYAVADEASDDEIRYHVQAWNVFGTVLSAIIFQGMLEMVNVMDDTFGNDLDDLNANSTLLSTERTIFYYLSEQTSKEHDPFGLVEGDIEEEVDKLLRDRALSATNYGAGDKTDSVATKTEMQMANSINDGLIQSPP